MQVATSVEQSVADLIARFLVSQGVKRVYGLCGEAFLHAQIEAGAGC